MRLSTRTRASALTVLALGLAAVAGAQEASEVVAEAAEVVAAVDETAAALESHTQAIAMVWTVIAAILVFFMQAGFAMVEAGFTRAKNACNILMKNMMDFCIGAVGYYFIGFGLMFGASALGGMIGTSVFALKFPEGTDTQWGYAFWFFQVVFAATACTIVSGAMAERTKFVGYMVYSAIISAIIYPIVGKWAWGSFLLGDGGAGWLEGRGFVDFAGSTVVHSVGGWAALAGALVIGPRIGKFVKGKPQAILGHSIPLAALGTFILFFGWFGFNAGSTTDGANRDIGLICVTTALSAATGAIGAMLTSWFLFKRPDTGMTLNGALAGLVGITAGCANVSPNSALVIGLAAGVLVVASVLFLERTLKIDDPVGAISVHGVCGVWGTLAAGIFDAGGSASILTQVIGIAAVFAWVFPTAFVLFFVMKKIGILRVSAEEEYEGLDITEHSNEAYAGLNWGGGSFGPMAAAEPKGAGAAVAVPAGAVTAEA
jgi:Amt family ammonium transporter